MGKGAQRLEPVPVQSAVAAHAPPKSPPAGPPPPPAWHVVLQTPGTGCTPSTCSCASLVCKLVDGQGCTAAGDCVGGACWGESGDGIKICEKECGGDLKTGCFCVDKLCIGNESCQSGSCEVPACGENTTATVPCSCSTAGGTVCGIGETCGTTSCGRPCEEGQAGPCNCGLNACSSKETCSSGSCTSSVPDCGVASTGPCNCKAASAVCTGFEVCGVLSCEPVCGNGQKGPCFCKSNMLPGSCSANHVCSVEGGCVSSCETQNTNEDCVKHDANSRFGCYWDSKCLSAMVCGDFPRSVCSGSHGTTQLNCTYDSDCCHSSTADVVSIDTDYSSLFEETFTKSSTEIKISPGVSSVVQTGFRAIAQNSFSLEGSTTSTTTTVVNVNDGGYSFVPGKSPSTNTDIKISTLVLQRNSVHATTTTSVIQAVSMTAISTSTSNTITLYQVSVLQHSTPAISPVIITNFNFVFMSVIVRGPTPTGKAAWGFMSNAENDCSLSPNSHVFIDLKNSEGRFEDFRLENSETGGIRAYGGRVSFSDVIFTNNKLRGTKNPNLFSNAFFEHGSQVTIGNNVTTTDQSSLYFSTPPGDTSNFVFANTYSLLFSPTANSFTPENGGKFTNGRFISCGYTVDIVKDNTSVVAPDLNIKVEDETTGDTALLIDIPDNVFVNPGTYNFDFKNKVGTTPTITRVGANHVVTKKRDKDGIQPGAIAAIVIAAVFVVAAIIVIALVAIYFHQKKKHALALSSEDIYDMESSSSSNAGDSV